MSENKNPGTLGRPAEALLRAVTALVMRNVQPNGDVAYLRNLGDERSTAMLLRAATTGGTLSDATWAGMLAGEAVIDFLASLTPISAGAALIGKSLGLDFGPGQKSLRAPGLASKAITGGFVEEGHPGRVNKFAVSGPSLSPKKMLILSVITRELAKRSKAEVLIKEALRQSSSLTLDAALFSADAASAAAPAGLLHDAIEIPASTIGGSEAMREDLAGIAKAVAETGAGEIVLLASPSDAVSLALQSGSPIPYPVFPTVALPVGTVAAAAPQALVFAADPVPSIQVSSETTLHMEDEAPGHISQIGTPNVVSAPAISLFQTDQIAIQLEMQVSWTKRHQNAVAYVEGIDWGSAQ